MNTPNKYKVFLKKALLQANIRINGNRPWDIKVNNEDVYAKVLTGGTLAAGETYMAGWWDCEKLDELVARILENNFTSKIKTPKIILSYLSAFIFNQGHKSKAFKIGDKHYDTGNDLFEIMLDKRLVYTCAYWKNAENLDDAQEAKLDLVCRKLGLKEGQKILDIGCGWGSFLKYAAEKYGISGVGITVSKEQIKLAQKLCKGLPIEIRYQDYRDLNEEFDHIVSLGMFEHVCYKNYRKYMKIVRKCLKNNGLFLLQTIGHDTSTTRTDPWIEKYIFPNSMIPSLKQINKAVKGILEILDLHDFGTDYDKTLMAWFENFNKNWEKISKAYNQTFYRMWKYYLLTCAGSFRARKNYLWQIVFSKNGIKGEYASIR